MSRRNKPLGAQQKRHDQITQIWKQFASELSKESPSSSMVEGLRRKLKSFGSEYLDVLVHHLRECPSTELSDWIVAAKQVEDLRLVENLSSLADQQDLPETTRLGVADLISHYSKESIVDDSDHASVQRGAEEKSDETGSVDSAESEISPGEAYLSTDENQALGAIERLSSDASEENASLLAKAAAESSIKEVQKAARKALYRLQATGLKVDIPLAKDSLDMISLEPLEKLSEAWVSQIDGSGSQFMSLLVRSPQSGLVMITVMVNDEVGVKDVFGMPATKKRAHRMVEDMRDSGMHLVSANPSYCHWLVKEAERRNQQTGTPLPEAFSTITDILGEPEEEYSEPIIYQLLSAEPVEWDRWLLKDSAMLLRRQEFEGWFLSKEEMKEFAQQRINIDERVIEVPHADKDAEKNRVIISACNTLFDEDEARRKRYQQRMEHMAYLLYLANEKDEAKLSLAVAQALAKSSVHADTIPFIRMMVEGSLSLVEAMERHGITTTDEASTTDDTTESAVPETSPILVG